MSASLWMSADRADRAPPGSNQAMRRVCVTRVRLVERGGFEPPKAIASRFTVCPVWPLRYLSAKLEPAWRTIAQRREATRILHRHPRAAATRTEPAPIERAEAIRTDHRSRTACGSPELEKRVKLLLVPICPPRRPPARPSRGILNATFPGSPWATPLSRIRPNRPKTAGQPTARATCTVRPGTIPGARLRSRSWRGDSNP